MLCGRSCITAEDVRAAVGERKQAMLEAFNKISSLRGKGLFRRVLRLCLDLGSKLGFRTKEADNGSYGVCETGEGDRTYVINIHLGKLTSENDDAGEVYHYCVWPAVSVLYSLRICKDLGGSAPFRIRVCLLPDEDGFLDCYFGRQPNHETKYDAGLKLIVLEQAFRKKGMGSWCNCVLHSDSEFKALQIAEEAENYAQQHDLNLVPFADGEFVWIDSFGGDVREWTDPWAESDAAAMLGEFLSTLSVSRDGMKHHTFTMLNAENDAALMLYALRDSVRELTGKDGIWRSYNDLDLFFNGCGSKDLPAGDDIFKMDNVLYIWSLIYIGAFLRLSGLYKEN